MVEIDRTLEERPLLVARSEHPVFRRGDRRLCASVIEPGLEFVLEIDHPLRTGHLPVEDPLRVIDPPGRGKEIRDRRGTVLGFERRLQHVRPPDVPLVALGGLVRSDPKPPTPARVENGGKDAR